QRRKLVGMRSEGKSGQLGDFLRATFGKFGMRIEPRTDRRSTDGKLIQPIENLLKPFDVTIEQARPATEFLANRQRHRILQMGATDFYHILKFSRLGYNGVPNLFDGWNETVLDAVSSCDMHGSRERIVR